MKRKIGNEPVLPIPFSDMVEQSRENKGLTKLELFSLEAMKIIIPMNFGRYGATSVGEDSTAVAKALIAELEKEAQPYPDPGATEEKAFEEWIVAACFHERDLNMPGAKLIWLAAIRWQKERQ